jgi:hypothetical protein
MAVHDHRSSRGRLADPEMGRSNFIHFAKDKLGGEGGELAQTRFTK